MSMEWRAAAVSPDETRPAPASWEPVEVPGRPAAFAGEDAVAYRTTFPDPRDEDDAHAVLVLDGLFAHARVWHDGEKIATSDAYVETLRLPIDADGENEVIVQCSAPTDRFAGSYGTDAVPDEAVVPGIWWDARLETHPDPYVADIDLVPRVEDGDAVVDVATTLYSDDPLDDRVTLSVRPAGETRGGGTMDRVPVDVPSGRSTVEERVRLPDAGLWWPHDMGPQPRYAIRAKLDDAARTVETGFCAVEYDAEEGLRINGQRARARGVNVVDATPDDAERVVAANANLLRAHAHAVSPAVREACDEAGVLLWEDLPVTGPGEFDELRGVDLAEGIAAAGRRHPSTAFLGVHDDPVAAYADGLGGGILDRMRFRWRAWRASYDDTTARNVADAVDDRVTFPVVGRPGIDPDAATLYPGWEFGSADSLAWVCDRYGLGDVVAEFGAGTDGRADDRAGVVGTVAEGLRRRGSDVIAAYALSDASDDGMGLLADGEPTPAFDRLATAYEPVQALLADPTPGTSDVVVVHDAPAPATVTVEWDVDGEREQTELDVDSGARETAGSVSLSAGDQVTLAVARDGAVTRNEYDI